MDPFTWALIYWLGVAAALYFGAQKALEIWPLDPPNAQPKVQVQEPSVEKRSPSLPRRLVETQQATPSYDEQREAKHRDIIDQQRQKILEQQSQLSKLQESLQSLAVNHQQANGVRAAWANSVIAWLHAHYNGSNDLLRATWLRSMNDAAKKVSQSCTCELAFEDILDTHSKRAPTVSDIKAEPGPREHLTLIGNVSIPELGVRMVCTQRKKDELLVGNYDALILELSGELHMRCACISNELFVMFCFNGRPNMRVVLKHQDQNAVALDAEAVEDALRRCIITCVTNVNMHQLQHDRRCNTITPQPSFEKASLLKKPTSAGAAQPLTTKEIGQISLTDQNTIANTQQMIQMSRQTQNLDKKGTPTSGTTLGSRCPHPKHLWVKVIRGQHLGRGEDVQQPVVCMEMDEPATRMETSKSLSINPYWEEEFICAINDKSSEMLFEVYDAYSKSMSGEPRFLGLAIVSLSELKASTSSLKNLQLQPRPYYNDPASGAIVVEFELLPENSPEVSRVQREMEKRKQNTPAVVLQPLLPPTTAIHHDRTEGTRIINDIIIEEASQVDSLDSGKVESTHVGERLEVTRRPLQMSSFDSKGSEDRLLSQNSGGGATLNTVQIVKSVSGYFHEDDKSPGPSSPTPLAQKLLPAMVKSKSLETEEIILNHDEPLIEKEEEPAPEMVATVNSDARQGTSPLDSYFREESDRDDEDATDNINTRSLPIDDHRAPTAISIKSNTPSQQDTVVHVQTHHEHHEYSVPIKRSTYNNDDVPPPVPHRDIIDDAWTPLNGHEDPNVEYRPSRSKRTKISSTKLNYTDDEPHLTNQPDLAPSRGRSSSRRRERSGFFRAIKDRLSMRRSTTNLDSEESTSRRPRARSHDQSNRYKTVAGYTHIENEASPNVERSNSLPRSPKTAHRFDGEEEFTAQPAVSRESVVSMVSTRSVYTHSTLIVEMTVDGKPKYYLIPQSMLDNHEARKLMRKGRKLHVFNEHIFVAVRSRAGTNCNVCGKTLRRSLGRQAYQCRDCKLVCHKRCHYTTDTYCQQSSIANLQIEYVWVEPGADE